MVSPGQTAEAHEANRRKFAEERAADPVKLGQAVRTVIAGVPRLTAEQVEQIRALLPRPPGNGDQAA
jgi:hypothetical protein